MVKLWPRTAIKRNTHPRELFTDSPPFIFARPIFAQKGAVFFWKNCRNFEKKGPKNAVKADLGSFPKFSIVFWKNLLKFWKKWPKKIFLRIAKIDYFEIWLRISHLDPEWFLLLKFKMKILVEKLKKDLVNFLGVT